MEAQKEVESPLSYKSRKTRFPPEIEKLAAGMKQCDAVTRPQREIKWYHQQSLNPERCIC
jgi:hypothetical protein